jgi:phosphomannomutase
MSGLWDDSERKREEPNLGTSAHVDDPSVIRFGTSGWRGVPGEDVTFDALRALARASSEWLVEPGDRDGFVMLRRSGTEPVIRIHAEARDRGCLARRRVAGEALLRERE